MAIPISLPHLFPIEKIVPILEITIFPFIFNKLMLDYLN
jgi:hypothetical protein